MLSLKTFMSRTRPGPGGCVEWAGCVDRSGYGRVGRAQEPAHRVAYRMLKGDPGDQYVCHSCDNPRCVNIDHLWLGSHTDNMRDMTAKKRHAKQAQTACINGHPFDANNTYVDPNGHRSCRECNRLAARASAARRLDKRP